MNTAAAIKERLKVRAAPPPVSTAADCAMDAAHWLALDTDEPNREKTADGHMRVKLSNFSKANVCPYLGKEIADSEELGLDPARIYYLYRDPIELRKGAPTADGKPILSEHQAVLADDYPSHLIIGSIGDKTRFNDPYLQGSLTFWSGKGIAAVESGKKPELSAGYRYRADMRPGRSPDGVPFDGVMRDIIFNHIAIVADGRAGADCIVGDSMEAVNMSKIKLSRAGAAAYGAIAAAIRPKLAKDQKLGLGAAFVGVTAKNYAERRAGIKLALDGALRKPGLLAQDAEAGEIIKTAAKMIDMFNPADEEGMDDDPEGMDGEEKKWGEDDEKAYDEMCERRRAAGAMDEDDETDEEKEARMKKRAEDKVARDAAEGGEKAPVTKAAMDAKLAKIATDSAAAIKAAETATVQRMNDMFAAKASVEPLVGKIAIACDSAEAVYSAALKTLGIATDGLNMAGMKLVIDREAAHRSVVGRGVQQQQQHLAMDSAGVAAMDAFRKANGLTHRAVKRA